MIDCVSTQGIFYCDISDHFPTFCINQYLCDEITETTITKRVFDDNSENHFCREMSTHTWNDVIQSTCTETAFSQFHHTYCDRFDNIFQPKTITIKSRNRKVWITPSLKKCIENKSHLYSRFIRHQTNTNKYIYMNYKKKLTSILHKAGKDYYDKLFQECKSNLTKSWKIIKEVINRNKRIRHCQKLIVGNQTITNKNIIASTFNNFFINIGPSLS